MLIKRFAHSCFLLQSEGGTRILTDPCDPATGYNVGPVEADCVTESHQHHDHNYTAAAKGRDVKVISAPGEYTVGDVKITGMTKCRGLSGAATSYSYSRWTDCALPIWAT